MNGKKQQTLTDIFYFGIILLGTAIFIFEIPFAVFYSPLIMLAAFFVYRINNNGELHLCLSGILLTIFAVVYVYFIYTPDSDLYHTAYIHIQAVIMFFIGYHFLNEKPNAQRREYLENYLIAVSVFYIAYTALTVIYYYKCTPADLEYRQYYSVWYAQTAKPATVLSMNTVIPVSIGVYFLFFSKLKKKIIGLCFVGFTVVLNLQTSTRTLLFLLPIIIIGELLGWLILEKKKRMVGGILFATFITIGIVFLFTYQKLFAFLADIFSSYSFSRVFSEGFTSVGRVAYSDYVLSDFSLSYMGGGHHTMTLGTPHNIWLYIYDWGGFISFVIYVLFTLTIIADYVLLLINKSVSPAGKMLLCTLGGVMGVEFFLEPFILPLPSFYILCMFVFGIVASSSIQNRKKCRIFC